MENNDHSIPVILTFYLVILHFVQLGLMWWGIVETRGRTLEEIEEIFEDPHPVVKSLQKHNIVVVVGEGVKLEEDA